MVKTLVIGFGSSGARHALVAKGLGCDVAVLSGQNIETFKNYKGLECALEQHNPDYIVVANATSDHIASINELARLAYRGSVLVEKPVLAESQYLPAVPFHDFLVAYNLRFHPIIRRIKSLTEGERIISVQGYVGQYLPNWRPARDYRSSYSAVKERGGGVLRDLSHELDYLTWIFGAWNKVTALGGKFSDLQISSDDVFSILMKTQNCPMLSIELNYLDRAGRRRLIVNTSSKTISADLIDGVIIVDSEIETFDYQLHQTYIDMHCAILDSNFSDFCRVEDGLEVVRLIEAIENALVTDSWVNRRFNPYGDGVEGLH